MYTCRRKALRPCASPCGSPSNPSIFRGFPCNISRPIFESCKDNSPNILEAMSISSQTTGVFSETIATAKLRPKSMACHYLRTPVQRTFFHACLPPQNAPQSNPLATQALNIAKNCIFSTVEIQGVEKKEKTPGTVPILVRRLSPHATPARRFRHASLPPTPRQNVRLPKSPQSATVPRPARADQFSNSRGTGILPVAGKYGQDARTTTDGVTQLEKLIGPARPACAVAISSSPQRQ